VPPLQGNAFNGFTHLAVANQCNSHNGKDINSSVTRGSGAYGSQMPG